MRGPARTQSDERAEGHPHPRSDDRQPRKKDTEASKNKLEQNQPVLVGFRAVYVFDVGQTEGAELPDLKEHVKGEVGEYRERLIDLTIAQGIQLEFKNPSHRRLA